MANVHAYRHGNQLFVRPAVDSATVIDRGDFIYLDTDDGKPASSYTWSSSDAATQTAFANVFIGIADEASASGDTNPINVDISATSVYEFTCVATTWEIGATFAVDGNGSDALLDQTLEKVGTVTQGIAKAVNRATASTAKVQVTFASAYHTGSSNSNAFV
jgi:hypothetical protein